MSAVLTPDDDFAANDDAPDPACNGREVLPIDGEIATAEFNGNQYYVLNVVRPGSATRTKDDIIAIRGIGADIDPRDDPEKPNYHPFAQERERLAELGKRLSYDMEGPSTLAVDSGAGLQPQWLLEEPLVLPPVGSPDRAPLIEKVEALGRRLSVLLGGDHTQDITRLYRMPGTTNYPVGKKLRLGRKVCRSTIIAATGKRYGGLDDLEAVVTYLEQSAPSWGLTQPAQKEGKTEPSAAVQRDPEREKWLIGVLDAADMTSPADLDAALQKRLGEMAWKVGYDETERSLLSAAAKLKWRGLTDVEIALALSAHQSMGKWVETGREADVHRHIARAVIGASGPGEADKPAQSAAEKLREYEAPVAASESLQLSWRVETV